MIVHFKRWFLHSLICLCFLVWLSAHTLAGTLTGTFSPIAIGSNVDLTAAGNLDWMHWGLYTDYSLDRKTNVAQQISNFTVVGSASDDLTAYRYDGNTNSYSWSDGSPHASVTNTATGEWVYSVKTSDYTTPDPLGSGFQFTVPADTSQKTLQVFVGAYASEGKFTASLSDNSAPPFTNAPNETLNNTANGSNGVFTLNFSADSPGQTLTVTWTVDNYNNKLLWYSPNVTLQSVTLSASNDYAPFVTLTAPANNAAFPQPATLALTANAGDFTGTITNVAFYSGTNFLGQTAASPYQLIWTNPPLGRYSLTAHATDDGGVVATSAPVEIFIYGNGGSQANSISSPPPSAVDLTAEGTADWTHWGLSNSASFDYKSSVPRQISNFTELGTNAVQQYSGNYTAFSWSDGTPTPSANGTATGVFVTGQSNGFRLTAPADTYPRQLRVYVGGYGVQGEFQAWLSDFSAPPLIDTASVSNVYGNTDVVYTINYIAATNNQQLIVIYHSLRLFDQTFGNVTLQAATLQGAAPSPVNIMSPQWLGNSLAFSFQTQTNYTYTVQYTYSLNPADWQTLTTFSGDGTTMNVTNQNAANSNCFYRVLAQ